MLCSGPDVTMQIHFVTLKIRRLTKPFVSISDIIVRVHMRAGAKRYEIR